MTELSKSEFVEFADLLTERQAEAFWYRRVDGIGRQAAADEMETSASNVDNLERKAHQKVMEANNLVSIVEAAGVQIEGVIGVCTECDEPTRELRPDPNDDSELRDSRMVCPGCHESLEDRTS